MTDVYTDGSYLRANPSWFAEDSPWKARHIHTMLRESGVAVRRVAEIGCGAGLILQSLAQMPGFDDVTWHGYDVSPQAIELASRRAGARLLFRCGDLGIVEEDGPFDLLLVIDVIEHVPDYLGFVRRCRPIAPYTIFHIPLDIHVSSVLRNAFVPSRYTIGHLHYFTCESALATLRDCGYDVLSYRLTNAATELFGQHPSMKRAVANVFRWTVSRGSPALAARLFGGYSLLVLAR
jgi:hypothetical protein